MPLVPDPTPGVDGRVVYLGGGSRRRFFSVLHRSRAAAPARTAVVLLPPFGYEELSSYRSVRAWARALAAAGHPALQVTLPGTGDSPGASDDPALVEEWEAAAAAAAAWLRETTGAPRIAAVGLGLGGLVACRARAAGAPIDDLLLWGVPAKGRRVVRELQALSGFGSPKHDAFPFHPVLMPALPPGALDAGGFVMGADTVADLRGIDLTRPGAVGEGGRSLVLGRDGTSADAALAAALEAAGTEVALGAGTGWAAMVDSPHLATVPSETIAASLTWLGDADTAPAARPSQPLARVEAHDTLPLVVDGVELVERAVALPHPEGRLFAVVTEPADRAAWHPLTAVLLNAGAERHIGANRMWVQLARRWAALGVPVMRLDILGVGDADGPDELASSGTTVLYQDGYGEQLGSALDAAEALGLPGRFVVSGLCSGAYWAFRLAVQDARVRCTIPLNARILRYDALLARDEATPGTSPARRSWREELRWRVLSWTQTPQAAPVLAQLRRPRAAKLIRTVWGSRTRGDALDRDLDLLTRRGQAVHVILSAGEALYGELRREGRLDRLHHWPDFHVERIPGPEDNHTFQVVRVQPLLHRRLDAALEAELARLPAAAGTPVAAAGRAA